MCPNKNSSIGDELAENLNRDCFVQCDTIISQRVISNQLAPYLYWRFVVA